LAALGWPRIVVGCLSAEAESRWRLVETAWQLNLPRAGVAVQADLTHSLLFVERLRRVNLTGMRSARNGYQKGHCYYCGVGVSLTQVDVDHFFPWILKDRGEVPDADGVWNLVLACQRCNRGEGGKFFAVPAARLIEKLHQRNNWLVENHHPLRRFGVCRPRPPNGRLRRVCSNGPVGPMPNWEPRGRAPRAL
jgi:5-methylcytosine-specific restriction endonuclease McrA